MLSAPLFVYTHTNIHTHSLYTYMTKSLSVNLYQKLLQPYAYTHAHVERATKASTMLVCVFLCVCVCVCVCCKQSTQKRTSANEECRRREESNSSEKKLNTPNQLNCSLVSYRHLTSAHRHCARVFQKFRFVLNWSSTRSDRIEVVFSSDIKSSAYKFFRCKTESSGSI